mgnify:CR=1 FL=1
MADDWTPPAGDLMKGKRGIVMGVANQNSIAWGIARQLAAQGAEIAFTYQGDSLERRVRPLVESIGMDTMIPADVTDDASMDAAFDTIKDKWGKIDFLVHSIAFAGKDELQGSMVANTTREGFRRAMDISVYSFIDCARRASEIMPDGGAMICMTYLGAERTVPSYNVMGVAKAALEAATRYAARDLGGRHAHAVAGRHSRRQEPDGDRPRLVAAQGRHAHGRRRRRGALPAVRPRPLGRGRSPPCRCRLPRRRRPGSARRLISSLRS